MRILGHILEPKLEIHLGFRNNQNQGLEFCQSSLFLAACEFVVFFSQKPAFLCLLVPWAKHGTKKLPVLRERLPSLSAPVPKFLGKGSDRFSFGSGILSWTNQLWRGAD